MITKEELDLCTCHVCGALMDEVEFSSYIGDYIQCPNGHGPKWEFPISLEALSCDEYDSEKDYFEALREAFKKKNTP